MTSIDQRFYDAVVHQNWDLALALESQVSLQGLFPDLTTRVSALDKVLESSEAPAMAILEKIFVRHPILAHAPSHFDKPLWWRAMNNQNTAFIPHLLPLLKAGHLKAYVQFPHGSPLMNAISVNNNGMIDALWDFSDPWEEDHWGHSAFFYAVAYGNTNVVQRFLEPSFRRDGDLQYSAALRHAVELRDISTVRTLLDAGVPTRLVTKDHPKVVKGNLLHAIGKSYRCADPHDLVPMVQMLVDRCDPWERDDDDLTPLARACLYRSKNMIK